MTYKPIYKAVNKEASELALDKLEDKWSKKYPKVIESWRNRWHSLSNYFKHSEAIREPIHTTNTVASSA